MPQTRMNTFSANGGALDPASEIKIPVDAALTGEILEWARTHMDPDRHGGGESGDAYRVTSLYFDTDGFDVFHQNGSYARSKYRVRRYGESERVFLERKLRVGQQVRKRRSHVGIEDLSLLANGVETNGWAGGWFRRRIRVRQLKPICQITYRRIARVKETSEGRLRLTVDQDVQACPLSGARFRSDSDATLVAPGCSVVELKFRHHMPALFKRLIEEFALEPGACSKYRLAATILGFVAADSTADTEQQSLTQPDA